MATLVVYLDLSKAYDSIVPAILLHKIYHIGFRGNLAYYLQNFLTNKRKEPSKRESEEPYQMSMRSQLAYLKAAVSHHCYSI